MKRSLQVQMTDQVFHASDSISILSFVMSFKTGCDSNEISEGGATGLVQYSMKNPSNAEPCFQMQLKSSTFSKARKDKIGLGDGNVVKAK